MGSFSRVAAANRRSDWTVSMNWTQNTVILEYCETDEQRAFYIRLAAERELSKLALMKAIQSGAFEAAGTEKMPLKI